MPRAQMPIETLHEPAEAALVRASRWAVAVTLACLPLYVVRFQAGPVPTTLLEVMVLATVAMYVVARWREGMRRPIRTPLDIPILVLLLAGLIAVVIPSDHAGALGLYRAYFVEPVLLFYVAADLVRLPRDFRTVLVGLGIGSTVFALLQLGAWGIALAQHSVNIRAAPEALYTSPNSVALYLEPPAALALGLVIYATNRRARWLALAWLALLFVASTLTLSRGLYVAFGAVLLFAVFSVGSVRMRLGMVGAAIVAAVAVLQVPYISLRVLGQHGPETAIASFGQRLSIWTSSLQLIHDHPVLGVGLRAYQTAIVPYVLPHEIPELYPHNVWLAFWAQLGLLGILSFVFIFLSLVVRGWLAFKRATGMPKAVLWGVLAALITFAVHGTVDTPYYKNDLAVEFWMLAALEVAAINAVAVAARQPSARRDRVQVRGGQAPALEESS
jgi:putative inorganic carbon (HCO3(-)) transporter